jgi:hypothetical protein
MVNMRCKFREKCGVCLLPRDLTRELRVQWDGETLAVPAGCCCAEKVAAGRDVVDYLRRAGGRGQKDLVEYRHVEKRARTANIGRM